MPLIEPIIPKILTRLNIFKNFHIFHRKAGLCSSFFFTLKQLADSEKFKCLMRDTDKELKEIDNHILKLKDLDYSLLEIIMLQDELCEKYSIRKGDKEGEDT